jgi:preprotein translocase subunit SecD
VEGIYWFRITAVAALFLGSIWVLLPSVFRESAESTFASQSADITTSTHSSNKLKVELALLSGDPSAVEATLKKRLDVAGVKTEKVKVEPGRVQVQLAVGSSGVDVKRLALTNGLVTYYAPSALGALPPKGAPAADAAKVQGPVAAALTAEVPAEADYWAAALQPFADAPVAQTAAQVTLPVDSGTTTADGGKVLWGQGAALPAEAPFVVVAVDGTARGIAFADGTVATFSAKDLVPLMVSGPLPGQIGEQTNAAQASSQAAVATSKKLEAPSWLEGMMPNTAIPLGLDLQGGIDLTLQVEVDEAVLGQVSRDVNGLKDAASKEGLTLHTVRRAHSQPVIEVTTDAPLAQLQEFMHKRAGDYAYVESEGNTHRFQLSDTRQEAVKDQAVEQVVETLRKRVDATGAKDPTIVKKSGGRINIQLPGMEDIQAAVDAIGTTAVLEFRMVDEEFDESYLEQIIDQARKAMPPDQFADDRLLDDWLWENKRLDPDRIVLWEYDEKHPETNKADRAEGHACGSLGATGTCAMALKSEVVLTGNDVNDAGVGFDQNSQAYVTMEFKPRGGQVFCDITGQNVGKRFAIILDNQIKSAPNIKERICGGAARIEMSSAEDPSREAQTLALVLRTGALDAPVVIASKSQVGATLGADAIREGTIAAVWGSVLVYLFMLLWYKTAGVVADIALTCNVLMVLASMGAFGFTLSLPGIAGIALTVGMAVDSNIIIYERIREELKLGVHPRKAVDTGFEKALVAVVDANITTAIAGIVLYSYGTGPIRGFALTLLIGIVTTLVTAVFVTRTIMDLLTRTSSTRLRI